MNTIVRYITLVVIGALLGAIGALLLAPSSGRKTRKKLRNQAKRWQLEFEAQTEKGFDRVNNWKQSVEDMAEDAAKNMNGHRTSELYN